MGSRGQAGMLIDAILARYPAEGERRTPFKGGALVGNVLDALANVRWSAETGFFGDYQALETTCFAQPAITGDEDARSRR